MNSFVLSFNEGDRAGPDYEDWKKGQLEGSLIVEEELASYIDMKMEQGFETIVIIRGPVAPEMLGEAAAGDLSFLEICVIPEDEEFQVGLAGKVRKLREERLFAREEARRQKEERERKELEERQRQQDLRLLAELKKKYEPHNPITPGTSYGR